ncbi:hypothetical protein FY036_13455 [Mesorhizobium microcysteis]|uniref:Uncharacterized protein n=1 Tax=Neoaquamicrobium microcysteis TaxID=2682781 RepID=A0A5D4GTP7_9HYPH|nr:hypothetical protein [Mesorhizobium microcysteis]TYR32086.1 hypothetical protein FY036_13455 [Mesorhizobium microcysteis]
MAVDDADEAPETVPFSLFVSQPDLPGLPARERRCLRCDEPVAAPKRDGRPTGFCSDECRKAQRADQVRAWHKQNPDSAPGSALSCWACERVFAAPERRAGRLPRYCCDKCRLVGRNALAAGYRARGRKVKTSSSN